MKTRDVYGMLLVSLGAALLAGGAGAQATDESAGAEAAEAEPLPPLSSCGPPSSSLIDDVEDGDFITADGLGSWYIFSDESAPQIPKDAADIAVRGGPGRSRYVARTAGPGFCDFGGVGISFGCARDVRGFTGYRFAIMGRGAFRASVLTVPTTPIESGGTCVEGPDPETQDCFNNFTTELLRLPDHRWYECSVRFSELAQPEWGTQVDFDPEAVHGVQFDTEPRAPFDLRIDDVRFATDVTETGCRPLQARHHPGPRRGH